MEVVSPWRSKAISVVMCRRTLLAVTMFSLAVAHSSSGLRSPQPTSQTLASMRAANKTAIPFFMFCLLLFYRFSFISLLYHMRWKNAISQWSFGKALDKRCRFDIIKVWKPRTVATSNLNPQSVSRNYLHNAVSRLFAPDGLLLFTRAYFKDDREDESHDARNTAQVVK